MVFGTDSEDDESEGVEILCMTKAVEEVKKDDGGTVGEVNDVQVVVQPLVFAEDGYIDISTVTVNAGGDGTLVSLSGSVRDIRAKNMYGAEMGAFGKDVELKIYYDDGEVSGKKMLEETLRIYVLDGVRNRWNKVGGTVDPVGNCVSVNLKHFSVYCIMGESSEAELAIENVANYPNPMTEGTVFTFELTRSARVKLEIYTVSGRLVKRYPEGEVLDAGYNEIPEDSTWDGTNENLEELSSGVYLYKITAKPDSDEGSAVSKTGKVIIIR